MDTAELLKKVKKIEIKTRKLSNHIFSGSYHTSFKGRGMTFSEVRQYQYGDDFRAIDWNVSAKNNDTYVKVFEEERELTLLLMIDCSASQYFGTSNQTKMEIAVEIAATLAFSAMQNNDKIGLLLFTEEVELFIPPKKGKPHVLRLIREILNFNPKKTKTNLSNAFEFASNVMKKKAIVFVLSDFMDTDYKKNLQILSKRHDVTGIKLFDQQEKQLTNIGIIEVEDHETGATYLIDTQKNYSNSLLFSAFEKQNKYAKNTFNALGNGYFEVEVNESYVFKLLNYFKNRKK